MKSDIGLPGVFVRFRSVGLGLITLSWVTGGVVQSEILLYSDHALVRAGLCLRLVRGHSSVKSNHRLQLVLDDNR